jgi:hypothetical protein
MFGQLREEAPFGSWAVQLGLAYVGPLAILMIASPYLFHGPDSPLLTLCEYLFIGFVSAALASGIAVTAFDATAEGRLVWIVPAGMFFAAPAIEGHRTVRELRHLFYTGPGEGESGWEMLLLTMPTWGCCCYSLVMRLWRRRDNGKGAAAPPIGQTPRRRAWACAAAMEIRRSSG